MLELWRGSVIVLILQLMVEAKIGMFSSLAMSCPNSFGVKGTCPDLTYRSIYILHDNSQFQRNKCWNPLYLLSCIFYDTPTLSLMTYYWTEVFRCEGYTFNSIMLDIKFVPVCLLLQKVKKKKQQLCLQKFLPSSCGIHGFATWVVSGITQFLILSKWIPFIYDKLYQFTLPWVVQKTLSFPRSGRIFVLC